MLTSHTILLGLGGVEGGYSADSSLVSFTGSSFLSIC